MIDAPHTYHALYLAVHAAHAEAPLIWTEPHCNRLLTEIMSSQPFSWRVVGITKAALKKFHELNYRYKNLTEKALTRAHLRPRIETVMELLQRDQPMSEREFVEYWLRHDETVICAGGENKPTVENEIPIENPHGLLFLIQQRGVETQGGGSPASQGLVCGTLHSRSDIISGRPVPTDAPESYDVGLCPSDARKVKMPADRRLDAPRVSDVRRAETLPGRGCGLREIR